MLSKLGGKDATILENNIVQTAGSAGESIAFGVGVTMPAIMILGFDLEITRVMLVAVLGGLLGILMMIPLRRALIVQQHGLLKYPEGTACAEVLKAGASPESIAAASASARREMEALGGASDEREDDLHRLRHRPALQGAQRRVQAAGRTCRRKSSARRSRPARSRPRSRPSCSASATSSARASRSIMCAGGVLAYLVLIPVIKFFGAGLTAPLAPGTTRLISDMSPDEIRSAYILYIGAGAVAAGGIISLLPLAADDLARHARTGSRIFAAAPRLAKAMAAHRPRSVDEVRADRQHRAGRGDRVGESSLRRLHT